MPTLHVYLDESGDFNFSPTGSRFYVFAVAWTFDPAPLAARLQGVRFGLLKQGIDVVSFHAAYDKQAHRNQVVQSLADTDGWKFAALVVEKSKVNPTIREEAQFYPQFASMLLRFVFLGCVTRDTRQVLILTDTIPVQKRREAINKAFRMSCRADLPRGLRFDIYHHPSQSNKWLQAVDYCAWALCRKWESGDTRTYDLLQRRLARPELDVTARGSTHYYRHPKA